MISDSRFLDLFSRLCVAFGKPHDDSGITQDVYFEALSDLDDESLRLGARELMREPGRKFFPTTAEWRTAASTALSEARKDRLIAAGSTAGAVECEACQDTGWLHHTCNGGGCERREFHAPHDYTVWCPCRPTNATYQRNLSLGYTPGTGASMGPRRLQPSPEDVKGHMEGLRAIVERARRRKETT